MIEIFFHSEMKDNIVGNYLRAHRKKSGLHQREVALLAGCRSQWDVARHERSKTLPPLLVALSYEAIFQVPVSALFAGVSATVRDVIEANVTELERQLESKCAKGREAEVIAEKLKWLKERRRKA